MRLVFFHAEEIQSLRWRFYLPYNVLISIVLRRITPPVFYIFSSIFNTRAHSPLVSDAFFLRPCSCLGGFRSAFCSLILGFLGYRPPRTPTCRPYMYVLLLPRRIAPNAISYALWRFFAVLLGNSSFICVVTINSTVDGIWRRWYLEETVTVELEPM